MMSDTMRLLLLLLLMILPILLTTRVSLHVRTGTGRQYYRLYTIHHIPTLRSLDYVKVTNSERATAVRLAESAAGAALEDDIAKNRHPFEAAAEEDSLASAFTSEQKERIRELLANATNIQQVEEIENSVKRGLLPTQLLLPAAEEPPTKRQKVDIL
jgi:U2 small nuclear ribonucleoprotein A'